MATEYRRRKGDEGQPWHFCSNCKQWPTRNFDTSAGKGDPVCAQCEALERRQMCTREDTYL